jgi:hypothetical protein
MTIHTRLASDPFLPLPEISRLANPILPEIMAQRHEGVGPQHKYSVRNENEKPNV